MAENGNKIIESVSFMNQIHRLPSYSLGWKDGRRKDRQRLIYIPPPLAVDKNCDRRQFTGEAVLMLHAKLCDVSVFHIVTLWSYHYGNWVSSLIFDVKEAFS